jgi:hypothetical protein
MPANFKVGDKVCQKMPAPIKGAVVQFGAVEGEFGYCIRYTSAVGDVTERWFRESELEAAS